MKIVGRGSLRKRDVLLWATSFITLGSGVVNVLSVINPSLPERRIALQSIFPLEFLHVSRFLTLLTGFALVVLSINIFKKKIRAFQISLVLAALSVVFHLIKGLDYEEAALSAVLVGVLLISRKEFKVRSSVPDLRTGVLGFVAAESVVLGYGVLGFWFLDKRHFGIDFNTADSIRKTLAFLSWAGDPELVPHTRYARWFLDSLYLISVTGLLYALYALFRPVIYQLRTLPKERTEAGEIVARHGRSSMEYFKLWPDKSYYFSPSGKSFLAYGVGANFALVLADPVGPEDEIGGIISGFGEYCREHDWRLAFHQTLPDFLPVYQELGFRRLKIGDEGVVDLAEFSLEGKRNKHLRHYANQFDKLGFRAEVCEPPVPDDVFAAVRGVSDEWLGIPGRKERGFTQGVFRAGYVRETPLFTVADGNGRIQAFANIIPSFRPGETTIDLMRHRADAPPGVMDYLFLELFSRQKQRGFTRFNLGMAPMSGFAEKEEASVEERAVHSFLRRLDFLFSYQGLLNYKKKFATSWEPRYVVYRNVLDLPRLAVGLGRVSAVKGSEGSLEDDE
jgi:phosphatidylglycerol lysyltransferase